MPPVIRVENLSKHYRLGLIRGRVVGLAEVGTRFHPVLAGRENIEPKGAILGMKTVISAFPSREIAPCQ